MVQEACISQMMAKKQNALRERKPRYQELFLQGFWKASQHGLPWNTVMGVKPKREQIWGLVLPLMKHRRSSSKREKRKERSSFFPAPCCFALSYYLHIVKTSIHWYSLCLKIVLILSNSDLHSSFLGLEKTGRQALQVFFLETSVVHGLAGNIQIVTDIPWHSSFFWPGFLREGKGRGLLLRSLSVISQSLPLIKTNYLHSIKHFILHQQGFWLLGFSHSPSLKFICPF